MLNPLKLTFSLKRSNALRFGAIQYGMYSDSGEIPKYYIKNNHKSNRMIRKGSRVQWNWGKGTAEGKVMETHTTKTTKTLKGATVTRNGTEDDRALYIKHCLLY